MFRLEIAEMNLEPNRVTPDTLKRIRQETTKDPVLAPLHMVIMNGWPSERKEPQSHLGCAGISETTFQFMMVFFTGPIKELSQLLYETRCYRKYTKHTRELTAV